MRSDKEKAIQLRLAGRSYKQIQRELKIPLGTLGAWFQNQPWSQKIKERLSHEVSLSNPKALQAMAASNKMRWAQWHRGHKEAAIREFASLKKNPLFLAGLMLYWGEGMKGNIATVKLSNSDPAMIRIFYLFLTHAVSIAPEKIFVGLINYPDLIDDVQKRIWSQATGIPLSQFKRSTVIQGRHPTKRNSYGVCMIMVHSGALKDRIMQWIELYKSELSSPFAKIVF